MNKILLVIFLFAIPASPWAGGRGLSASEKSEQDDLRKKYFELVTKLEDKSLPALEQAKLQNEFNSVVKRAVRLACIQYKD